MTFALQPDSDMSIHDAYSYVADVLRDNGFVEELGALDGQYIFVCDLNGAQIPIAVTVFGSEEFVNTAIPCRADKGQLGRRDRVFDSRRIGLVSSPPRPA